MKFFERTESHFDSEKIFVKSEALEGIRLDPTVVLFDLRLLLGRVWKVIRMDFKLYKLRFILESYMM